MRLVIAEKPSVAQSIAAVLGAKSAAWTGIWRAAGISCRWCFGHLAELADAAVYNADVCQMDAWRRCPSFRTSFRFIVRSEKQKPV